MEGRPTIRTVIRPVKVGPAERLSSGADKFPIETEEDTGVEIAIFSERGARDLEDHLGRPVEVVLEEGRPFRGTRQFKVVGTPSWSRKPQSGQSNLPGAGATRAPEDVALTAASERTPHLGTTDAAAVAA